MLLSLHVTFGVLWTAVVVSAVVGAIVVGGVVDGRGVVDGGGDDVGQAKPESLSTPDEENVTKPGRLLPVMLLIQSWYLETRV